MTSEKRPYLTESALKRRPGWTDTAIRDYLPPEPDATRPNQWGTTTRLWLVERIDAIEAHPSWSTRVAKGKVRQERAKLNRRVEELRGLRPPQDQRSMAEIPADEIYGEVVVRVWAIFNDDAQHQFLTRRELEAFGQTEECWDTYGRGGYRIRAPFVRLEGLSEELRARYLEHVRAEKRVREVTRSLDPAASGGVN